MLHKRAQFTEIAFVFVVRNNYPNYQSLARVTLAIYSLRFCSNLFIHILSLRNLDNDPA